jgi:hypothetical protein
VVNGGALKCECACMTTDLPHSRSQAPSRYVPKTSHNRSKPVQPPKSHLGAFGLTLAVIGLALALVPLLGFDSLLVLVLGIVFSGIAIVLSLVALRKVVKARAGNRGISYLAIVLSVVAVALCVTWYTRAEMTSGAGGLHLPAVGSDRHTVEFAVTSTGGASVRYGTIGVQRVDRTPASTDEWRQKASYNRGSYLVTLTADNTSSSLSNTITCSLYLDGSKVAENTGTTIALCTAQVG